MAKTIAKREVEKRLVRRKRASETPPAVSEASEQPVALAGSSIRIRMYRVGFGDCFLVTLPTDAGDAHILFDCGVHSRGNVGTLKRAVENLAVECGGHLALVVATHAHQDHISGFGAHADIFRTLKVDHVWMPWTENEGDPQAAGLRQRREALTMALTNRFAAAAPRQSALAVLELASGNAAALTVLKAGINGGKVRYLAGDALREEGAAGIPGLSVRVLGPPRDEAFLGRMDPPSTDRFLRAAGSQTAPGDAVKVFSRNWAVSAEVYPEASRLNDRDLDTLSTMDLDPEGLAFALDQAINNTSLVLLLSYRGRNLLFAGDAQYGNWQSWMNGPEGTDILESIDVYKVSHHGSHNATPHSAIERMTKGRFAALLSTQAKPWPTIPYNKLMTALAERAKAVVRSDSLECPNAPIGPAPTPCPNLVAGAFWYDYHVPL